MICGQSLEHSRDSRRPLEKATFKGFVTDLILADAAAAAPRPQAFLVEQVPRWTLPTHFHQEHQFQVFVSGSGHLGKTPIQHLSVHYASPHSAYGPLVSGEDGVAYLTLRAVSDTGAWFLPQDREHLQLRIPKQQVHGTPTTIVTAQELRKLPAASEETLIAPSASGLAAWLVRIPPEDSTAGPAPELHSAGGGRFHVVTQGSLVHAGNDLPALATVFASPDDPLTLSAGSAGLEILVLQFPAAATQSFVEAMAPRPA